MSGSGDRLHDVRQRPTFNIEKAALAYVPRIGPAAWATYCYLISLASEGDTRWPDLITVASACGISTYNAQLSIESLISAGLIARHSWIADQSGPSSFAVLPARSFEDTTSPPQDAAPEPPESVPLMTEESNDEKRWRVETEERDLARQLFSRMLEALDVDPGDLSERARTTATEASRLARAVGASPEDVGDMIDRIRRSRPDMFDDAERILEYWSELFAEMSDEDLEPFS